MYTRVSIDRVFGLSGRAIYLILGSSFALITITKLMRSVNETKEKFIQGPQNAADRLRPEERCLLPYPPSIFSGRRDVATEYGSTRVYEFGPADGQKILFIHGISTPCISFGSLALELVSRGCRVLLFDLYGRGYSDCPSSQKHNTELYSEQIFAAIGSSKLDWVADGFWLIGYSLGGGIAADFAALHGGEHGFVKGVALLGPGGLLRERHVGWEERLLYLGFVPEMIVESIVRKRLYASNLAKASDHAPGQEINDELKGNLDPTFEDAVLCNAKTVRDVVKWQLDSNPGFPKSFVGALRYASITNCHSTWARLGGRNNKVIVIVGRDDGIIKESELRPDAEMAIGKESLTFRVVEGGHEFPITRAQDVAQILSEVWTLEE